MPVTSKKMTTRGETYPRFLERNERKEIRMALQLKKKPGAEKPAKTEKPEKESKALKTPVEPKHRDGDRYGKTLGLKLSETFIHVLRQNEDAKKGHKSDDELIKFFAEEFGNRHNRGILYNIREIRWRYNFGKLTPDEDGNPVKPELQSNRYDDEGNVWEKKTSASGMTEEEKALKIEERRALEVKRREEEDSKIEKAEEKFEALKTKVEERRTVWETKNGPLQENQPVAKAKTNGAVPKKVKK